MNKQTSKALELARSAFDVMYPNDYGGWSISEIESDKIDEAIAAIDAALSAPAAPVAQYPQERATGLIRQLRNALAGGIPPTPAIAAADTFLREVSAAHAAPAAPVAQPLTDEQVAAMFENAGGGFLSLRETSATYARGLRDGERAHGIGQGGAA